LKIYGADSLASHITETSAVGQYARIREGAYVIPHPNQRADLNLVLKIPAHVVVLYSSLPSSLTMRFTTLIPLLGATLYATLPSLATPALESLTGDAFLPERLFPELQAIIVSAEANAPILRAQSFLRDEAAERMAQAKARYYPNVRLFSHVGPREEYRSGGGAEDISTFAVNVGINLYRPIYHWGAIEAGIEQARLANENASMDYSRKRSDLIRRLRADYLNLHLTEQALHNEKQRQTIMEERIKRSEVQYQSGKISETEFRSTLLEKESSLLNLERMNAQRARLLKRFKNNYGWEGPLRVSTSIPEVDIADAIFWLKTEQAALDQSIVYELYPIQKRLNALRHHEEQQTIIKSKTLPLVNLFLSGTQGQTNTARANDVDTLSLTAGINVTWNIFDGFRTKHQKIEAKLKQRRLEAELKNHALDLMEEQQQIIDSLLLKFRELNIIEQQFTIKATKHMEAEKDFEAGRSTKSQRQSSRLALESLQLEVYRKRADTLMGVSDYKEFKRLTSFAQ